MLPVLIVNYKTTELTNAAVLSVKKHCSNAIVTVYDSSSDYTGTADTIIKNEIDFDVFKNSYPNKVLTTCNDYGSAKHCYTVDYCFKFFNDGFILLDSDVLVKRDLSELYMPDKIWVGQSHTSKKHKVNISRLYPFCCFINTKMCKEYNIHYFNGDYMWELTTDKGRWYDTGAWFLEATSGYPHKEIHVTDYIEHYGNGSFNKNKKVTPEQWLNKYSNLYK